MRTNKIIDIFALIMVVAFILIGMNVLSDENVILWAFVDLYSVVVLIIFANKLFEQKSGIMHYRVISTLLALAAFAFIVGNIITPSSWHFLDVFSITVSLLAILQILTRDDKP